MNLKFALTRGSANGPIHPSARRLSSLRKTSAPANDRGEAAGLSDEEIAFYDTLAENESGRAAHECAQC